MVNGHVVDETRLRHVPRAQPPQLFRNLGTGKFVEIVPPAGSGLDQLLVGRGAAYGDYDGDGDLDILVSQNQGPALLLRNDTPRQAHYLRVHLRGPGATVTALVPKCACIEAIRCSGKWCVPAEVTTAERASLTFGLGQDRRGPRGDCVALRQRRCLPGRAWGYDPACGRGPSRTGAWPFAAACRCPAPAAELPQATTSQTYLAHTQAGLAAYRAERYAEAAQAFEAARSLQPSEPLPYRYLADLYWRQGNARPGGAYGTGLAKVMPDAYFLDRLGSSYEESAALGLAMLLYREATRVNASFPSARPTWGVSC